MQSIIIVFCFSTLLFGQHISEKLILNADRNNSSAQINLVKLKMFFIENEQTRSLQEKYKFMLMLETLDEYSMVVIKPVKSQTVKNKLLLLLSPHFPDIFSIHDSSDFQYLQEQKNVDIFIDQERDGAKEPKQKNILDSIDYLMKIGLQWIALLFLSVAGLILSVKNRRKMASLETMQRDLSQKQEEIEKKIKHLGARSV